ncbi:MAG: DNA-binding domain-containing protein [Caldimonas sp.]
MTAATSLDAFQHAFSAALLGDATAAHDPAVRALLLQPAFSVYRNTVASACTQALADNYPSVLQIVGRAWFDAAAALFLRSSPPVDGRLAIYGASFPDFLGSFEPGRELPYLPGVALLDRLWTESHLAADEPLLGASALAGLAAAELAGAVLVPHASARWATFAEMPIYTLWQRHREGLDVAADLSWQGECALLTRPGGTVEWRSISPGEAAFLDACAAGASFAEAASCVGDDVARALPRLIACGAFSRCLP